MRLMRHVALAALALAGPAWAQDTRSINVAPTLAPVPAENATLGELMSQVSELQREVQRLRGELEQQTYQLRQLKQQQKQLYTDLDKRLSLLATPQLTPPPLTVSVEPQTTTVAPATTNPPQAQATPADPALYDQALEYLKQGEYPKAAAGFSQFLEQKPEGERAENAHYWLAEALYVNRQLPEAQATFERLLSTYPNSTKAADALYKIGLIQLDAGSPDKAKQTLAEVQTRYPGSTAARLAEQRLRRFKPGGT